MTMRRRSAVSVGVLLLHLQLCLTFQFQTKYDLGSRVRPRSGTPTIIVSSVVTDEVSPSPETELRLVAEAVQLKDDLITLASATRRGFSASRSDRNKANNIIKSLSKYSPCNEPAAAYYTDKESEGSTTAANESTLAGKWTLMYTDAPDITSLDSGGPFATAKLGRIGQECNPPSIKNVIEWLPPDWASSLPFISYDESSRVLQKVCCEGSATPQNPKAVDLKLVGLELLGEKGTENGDGDEGSRSGGFNSIFGGPAALLENNPLKLQGPLSAPFGKFEILYLDDVMRITKTYQGYVAVNVREADPWF